MSLAGSAASHRAKLLAAIGMALTFFFERALQSLNRIFKSTLSNTDGLRDKANSLRRKLAERGYPKPESDYEDALKIEAIFREADGNGSPPRPVE
jgi:hypothetical protein